MQYKYNIFNLRYYMLITKKYTH